MLVPLNDTRRENQRLSSRGGVRFSLSTGWPFAHQIRVCAALGREIGQNA